LLGSSLGVIDYVAQAEFKRAVAHVERDDRFQRRIQNFIIVTDDLPRDLRFDQVLADGFSGYAHQHFAGVVAIAGGGEEDFNFVPNELEALRVVEDGAFQHCAIRDADQASVVQIFADPAPCFHQGSAQESDVDDVAARVADLNSISYRVELRKTDGESTGDAGDHVLQSDGNARADHADGKAEAAQAIFEEDAKKKDDADVSKKSYEFASSIAGVGTSKVARKSSLEDAEGGVNDDNADNCGNTFGEERE
jgi:hypothetical protein